MSENPIPEGIWWGGTAFHSADKTFAPWGIFGRSWFPRREEFPQGMGRRSPADLARKSAQPNMVCMPNRHDYILEIRVGSTIHKCRNCGHTLKVITDVQVITNVEGPDA